MKKWFQITLAAVSLAVISIVGFGGVAKAQSQVTQKTIYIGPERVDCVGVAPQKCYQYKEDPNGEWQLFYSGIEGFDSEYEEGYIYELEVEVTTNPNPPADGSSMSYKLTSVVNKTPAQAQPGSMLPASIVGKMWDLVVLQRGDLDIEDITGTGVNIMFDAEGRISSSGGCNRYFGSYEVGDNQSLTIKGVGSTRMACAELKMKLEADYFTVLENVASWVQDDPNRLQLRTNDGRALGYIVASEMAIEVGMPRTGVGRVAPTLLVLGVLLTLSVLSFGLILRGKSRSQAS